MRPSQRVYVDVSVAAGFTDAATGPAALFTPDPDAAYRPKLALSATLPEPVMS